jgi:hypothetical protein
LKSDSIRLQSYDHYLKLNPRGSAQNSIRYQRAKLFYDQNQWKLAYSLFDDFVSDSEFSNQNLKLKSAHLALDSLVLLKDIETLEEKSLNYARAFPSDAIQFHQISRKAGLQIVKTMATKDTSKDSAKSALSKLLKVTIQGSDAKEAKSILKMKIDLALKAQEWETANASLDQFLKQKAATEADVRWALTKKLALSELFLDFTRAYQIVQRLNYQSSKLPEELLKGALLAELSQNNPKPWLEKVVHSPKSSKAQSQLARAQLVRLQRNLWAALHKESSQLTSKPVLFSDLALEAFAKDSNFTEARWALSQRGVKSTWAGQTLQRMMSLSELQQFANTVKRQKLNGRTPNLLTSSLRNRIQSLGQLKDFFRKAQRAQDWTLQVMAATHLRNENERLAQEIENLPIPKKLSAADQKTYALELLNQSMPFRKTAEELNGFLGQSWADDRYIKLLLAKIESQNRVRNLLMNELRTLASVAPSSTVSSIKSVLDDLKEQPSRKDVASTQKQLRQDPLDLGLQNELLGMEKKLGNHSMVVFLQSRNESIKGGLL